MPNMMNVSVRIRGDLQNSCLKRYRSATYSERNLPAVSAKFEENQSINKDNNAIKESKALKK